MRLSLYKMYFPITFLSKCSFRFISIHSRSFRIIGFLRNSLGSGVPDGCGVGFPRWKCLCKPGLFFPGIFLIEFTTLAPFLTHALKTCFSTMRRRFWNVFPPAPSLSFEKLQHKDKMELGITDSRAKTWMRKKTGIT